MQRLDSFGRAMQSLSSAVTLSNQRPLSDLEQQGLIQSFEFTHELAWNCLRDYLQYQGEQNMMGSRDATRRAFSVGLISDGDAWMDMIASRNLTSHTYNQETAAKIVEAIRSRYFVCFEALRVKLNELASGL